MPDVSHAVAHPTTDCCRDYESAARLSRRRFLTGMAATTGAAVATSVFGDAFRQTAFADTTGGNVLVVISLRGGIDGLGMVVPHGDPVYYTARPTIAVPKSSLVCADSMFGLHPQMAPLQWLWDEGSLAAVHAVGLAVPNRSHFSAMEEVEDADPGTTTRQGWVNRMIGLNTRSDPQEAVHLTDSILPTILSGPAPALAASRLDQISLVGAEDHDEWSRRRRSQLDRMWAGGSGALYGAYRSAARTVDLIAPAAQQKYTPTAGVTYPRDWPATDLSDALKDTAQLIKADVGTDVVSIDFGSWDMHSDYGTTAWGDMQNMVQGFAGVLDAFMRDLGDLRQRVTLVTISEFGRRIKENGNRGLDHGWGNMMLVMGAGVKGGRYYGSWTGLGTGADDDLQVTTDYRNVFGEIVARRFPDRSLAEVFPGLSYSPVGLMS
jgi:uncharacterized protein (DUF1501 family)